MKVKLKQRNYLVPLLMKKSGGGKHKNKKRELKHDGYREGREQGYTDVR